MHELDLPRALNVLQSKMLSDSVGEEEAMEARTKAKTAITKWLYDDDSGVFEDPQDFVYDQYGTPRPNVAAYNERHRDNLLPPLPPETLPVDAEKPFPGLDGPMG